MAQALTTGVHHVGLTVPDIAATRAFFVNALGFEQVGERPKYPAVFVSDGAVMVTLWQAVDPATARPPDRKTCIGLHHLALATNDLDMAYERVRGADGVAIEFAPEPLGDHARHFMCIVPDWIRLELIQVGGA